MSTTVSKLDIMEWDKIHIKTELETVYSCYHKEEMTQCTAVVDNNGFSTRNIDF